MRTLWKCSAFACAILFAESATASAQLVQIPFKLSNFSQPLTITNRFFPLAVGRHVVFYEVDGEECVVDDVIVTNQTKQFGGPYAGLVGRVVTDQAWRDEDCDGDRDLLIEDTFDWYAQDNSGHVWYLGEDTVEYEYDDNGQQIGSSTEGSWEAGVDGAIAGLIMLARPQPGLYYRQEYYKDVAEDMAKVLEVRASVSIGLGDFTGCIVTREWSRLSPGGVELKSFCPNVGLVLVEGIWGNESGAEAIDLGLP
jgi:hypothetical protein